MANKTYSFQFLFDVVNNATGPFRKIALSIDDVGKRAISLGQKLDVVGKRLQQQGKSIRNFGGNVSKYLTLPIVGFGVAATLAWDKQAKAEAQVEAGIKSTGGTAKLTLQELKKLASEIQSDTLFGDEEILTGATAQLLTFTNITGETFGRTQRAIVDVATRLKSASGGAADLTGTSVMLGKALNDPIKGIAALNRVGIQFTEQQKAQIEQLQKAGKLQEAQALILNELELQYKGSAAAAAKAGAGGFKQLTNQIGDLMEVVGKLVYNVLSPMIPVIQSVVANISEWVEENPRLATIITTFALILAALGPIIVVAGTVVSAIGSLSVAMSFLAVKGAVALPVLYSFAAGLWATLAPILPVILAIAALGAAIYLIYDNWTPIKTFFVDLWEKTIVPLFWNAVDVITFILSLLNPALFLYKNWTPIKKFFFDIIAFVLRVFDSLPGPVQDVILSLLRPFIVTFRAIGDIIDWFSNKFFALINLVKEGWSWLKAVAGFTGEINTNVTTTQKVQGAQSAMSTLNENKTEVVVKVEADNNSTATVSKARNVRGRSKVNVQSGGLGASFATAS
jgi:hypothetical protein